MNNAVSLTLAIALVIAGLVGYYWFADQSILIRVLVLIGGVIAGLAVAASSAKGKEAMAFIAGSRTELRKVVWPERKEVSQVTVWVLIAIVVTGAVLWIFDWAAYALIYRLILGVA